MNSYELMMVLSPNAPEEAVTGVLERVTRYINDKGGNVESQDLWGRRRLAYPINRHLEGQYYLTHMELPPDATAELEHQLQINEQVLRHLLVRREV